ncbi:MAG: ADP-ribosylglycohydrolase family protein, partial [Promethearchaeota archaeon]
KDWRSARQEIYDKLIQWHPIDPIEVLSITTCLFKITQGDYKEGVIAGTNIGRDADTIANLIGLLAGAMHGINAIPLDWREGVLEINPSLYNSFKNKSFQFAQLLRSKFHNYRHIIDEFENIDR